MGGAVIPRGIPNTGEFKQRVVETVRAERLTDSEAERRFNIRSHGKVAIWERIYLEEGPEGLYVKRPKRSNIWHPPRLKEEIEEDLIAENRRFRAEVDSLKKLHALVSERVRREKKLK